MEDKEISNQLVLFEPEQILSTVPSTGFAIREFASTLLQKIDDGEVDPLQIHVQLKAIEKIFKEVSESDGYKASVRNSAEAYGKEFERFGAKIKLAEAGVKYDYSECGHVYYEELCQKIETMTEKKKEYESDMKKIKVSKELFFYDKKHTVYPPKKSSTSTVNVSF
jgi:hypothetical protein